MALQADMAAEVAGRATCTELRRPMAGAQHALSGLGYLSSYPAGIREQVSALLAQNPSALGPLLLRRYPQAHAVRTDKAL